TFWTLSLRHEILRTGFECLPGMRWPVQVIAEQTSLPFNEVCLDSASDDFIAQLCEEERDFLIDGQADLTGRFILLHLGPAKHILVISLSALCADTRTLNNLFEEIAGEYQAKLLGNVNVEETVQYVQFSEWQHELLETDGGEGRSYWNMQQPAGGSTLRLPLEATCENTTLHSSNGRMLQQHIAVVEPELAKQLEAFTKQHDATIGTVMLAGWMSLLWRLTSEPEITVKMQCDGRVYEEMEAALGLYARWPSVSFCF